MQLLMLIIVFCGTDRNNNMQNNSFLINKKMLFGKSHFIAIDSSPATIPKTYLLQRIKGILGFIKCIESDIRITDGFWLKFPSLYKCITRLIAVVVTFSDKFIMLQLCNILQNNNLFKTESCGLLEKTG